MASLPAPQQAPTARLFYAAAKAAANGVTDATTKLQHRYWGHWKQWCKKRDLDPFLQSTIQGPMPSCDQLYWLGAFAEEIRLGGAGRGHQVRVGSVQDALAALATTFQLAGINPPPTHTDASREHYHKALERQLKGYRKEDPPTEPHYAVPVSLIEAILDEATNYHPPNHPRAPPKRRNKTARRKAKALAIADLVCIAFFFLLRVGEYTKSPKSQGARQTIPFRVGDVILKDANHKRIPLTASLALLQATEATISIPNQKNGVKGSIIRQECTGTRYSPVRAIARRIYSILSNGGNLQTPIYTYYAQPNHAYYITASEINTTLKDAAALIDLYTPEMGYTKRDISSHSLRAGGAMAMHLNGVDALTIQKQGRWRSQTFLCYIHEQISAFSTGLSIKMSQHIPFRAIAGPTLLERCAPMA